jgi:hypothetical protein
MLARIWCAIVVVCMLASTSAHADEAAPTPAQLARAKKAFSDGKKLHGAGKLAEAIEKFKASYELSKNPLLLYNIGLTMQELGSDDLAVVYYRKFLVEAPADAPQRQDVTARIAALTAKLAPVEVVASTEAAAPPPTSAPPAGAPAFVHHPVEAAPPDKPLDVTALVAPDAGLTLTLYVRAAGEAAFIATPMIQRQKELVGRIPAARMIGPAVQYYLEARDAAGAVVAHAGKASSPNVITLDVTASTQFYPDISDPPVPRSQDREDPLTLAGGAPRDDGVRPFGYARWTATTVAGVSLGLGVVMYFLARDHAAALEDDAVACGTPPCQQFDAFDRDLQSTGKREQTIANVALIGGAASAVVAGYFWYRALTAPRREDTKHATRRWRIAPAFGADYTGGTAAVGF